MAVVSATTIQVKPDRWEAFVETIRRSKNILEGYGAKNSRLLAGLVAGAQTGTIVLISEFDNFAAQGAFEDRALADPEVVSMMRVGPDSPHSGFQTSLFVDVPL